MMSVLFGGCRFLVSLLGIIWFVTFVSLGGGVVRRAIRSNVGLRQDCRTLGQEARGEEKGMEGKRVLR